MGITWACAVPAYLPDTGMTVESGVQCSGCSVFLLQVPKASSCNLWHPTQWWE